MTSSAVSANLSRRGKKIYPAFVGVSMTFGGYGLRRGYGVPPLPWRTVWQVMVPRLTKSTQGPSGPLRCLWVHSHDPMPAHSTSFQPISATASVKTVCWLEGTGWSWRVVAVSTTWVRLTPLTSWPHS